MTNKQFFIETITKEIPVFQKVMQAVPEDKASWKPHEKARSAGSLVIQLGAQPVFISGIITEGLVDFSKSYADEKQKMEAAVTAGEKNWAELKKQLEALSDKEWETGEVTMKWPGGEWKTKKYDMAWGFLFDAIHHRGQLSTYIRIFGGKVPSIYGGSADAASGA